MKIYFVRHAKTKYNEQGKVMGYIDEPLSQDGVYQAKNIAEQLRNQKFDIIYCSPLQRAKQTAQEINKYHNALMFYDPRIIERDCGELAGKDYSELDNLRPNWSWVIGDTRCTKLRVETVDSMMERVQDLINQIDSMWPDKKILFVSHSGIASVLNALQHKMGKGESILQRTPNAQLLEFDVKPTKQEEKE